MKIKVATEVATAVCLSARLCHLNCTQQVRLGVTPMGSTHGSSTRAHKMGYCLVLLILMSVLGMLKVFYVKSDKGKLFAATRVVFIPR